MITSLTSVNIKITIYKVKVSESISQVTSTSNTLTMISMLLVTTSIWSMVVHYKWARDTRIKLEDLRASILGIEKMALLVIIVIMQAV